MRTLVLAMIALLGGTAVAGDTPEAAFARYHRAMMQADVDTMLRLSTEAQRARMKIDVDWKERAHLMPVVMPSSYVVTGRAAGATRAVLNIDATGGAFFSVAPDKPGKSTGKVTLMQEGGEWRVDKLEFQPVIEPNPHAGTERLVDPSIGAKPAPAPQALPRAVGAGRKAQ